MKHSNAPVSSFGVSLAAAIAVCAISIESGCGSNSPDGLAAGGRAAAQGGNSVLPDAGKPASNAGGSRSSAGNDGAGGERVSFGGSSGGVEDRGGMPGTSGGELSSAGDGGRGGRTSTSGGSASGGGGSSTGGRGSVSGGRANGGASGGTGVGGDGGTRGGAAGSDGTCERYDASNPPQALALTGNLGTHDPSAMAAEGKYYLFQTGRGIPTKSSSNLLAWQAGSAVFSSNPSWIAQQVSGVTDLWAPDISYFGGIYHLYYAASTFGSNQSCIGHATRTSLGTGTWEDQGPVICSKSSDDFNAIDPNVVLDDQGIPWLSLGSFWSGIKIIRLDGSGKRADTEIHSIASRNGGAIEAPYIVHHCGYYFLFVSFDACCKGVDSTYKIMVGRATSVLGPYQDKAGKAMMQGGGTLLVQGDTRWHGPGHNAVLLTDHGAFNLYHSYDANNNGNSYLRISNLVWDENGWPLSGGP